jgi:hypothetical protein
MPLFPLIIMTGRFMVMAVMITGGFRLIQAEVEGKGHARGNSSKAQNGQDANEMSCKFSH